MHPHPAFRTDPADALDRLAAIGFAHLCVATPAGPMVVHRPVTRHDAGLRFHVAGANRASAHLDGATVLVSAVGVEAYVSPNWYARPGDQVPTGNYVAIEVDGHATRIDEAALVEHLDALAAAHEPRVNPAAPWTRGKMDDAVFRRMLSGIAGYAIAVAAVRVTDKLSRNKPAVDRAGVVAGLRAGGNAALAAALEGAA